MAEGVSAGFDGTSSLDLELPNYQMVYISTEKTDTSTENSLHHKVCPSWAAQK
jgi:hypothetical protein